MELAISVTPDHIGKGRPSTATECPVALAIEDAIQGRASRTPAMWVNYNKAAIYLDGISWVAEFPQEVRDFIIAFDKHEPVRPVRATLQLVEVAA